ncbi:circularly permuted type 2 ATP-grasp protein [Histidinibacterium aquaticum]|uniref:Uncharacterized protein n=1 Tax=Histidinibacterium aquaticum TaxID=2613962 RepID=A0A5J5GG92_9RHOB|nr:circularly permuted type 2 ATP-grasp protein [Histidinibacterium aquaticum]KAA9006743.1 hypothetical protein F3S47_13250 [Histidinibacterium aquaticum]
MADSRTIPPPLGDALLSGYRPRAGVADELLRPDGSLRPVWQPLIDVLSRQTPEGLAQRFARGDQYLHDAGVYYRQYTTDGSTERDWPLSHVPVMIGADEWQRLSAGIAQRAELLERVMADLYGSGNLVREGLLPAQVVAQSPEWLRPLVGIQPRSGHFLYFLAFEIGRSPDGSWFVLGDRTQAPSGAGFALENRIATLRIFSDHYPQANVERLAGFFRQFRDALNGLRDEGSGRVAILTPGQETDTFFEHAYIARYLGFTLLEGEDLRIASDRLAVRTVRGPEPLSVIWRRLDSRYADPLELDENSALGTPGMVAALRAGAATMVNCLGSGVLETRALLAFLPGLCERLMGEPLKLPNIATWWCGAPAERDYVRQNLDRMLVGPAFSTRLPFESDRADLDPDVSIEELLDREGERLVGQEAVTLSTTPAFVDGQLRPRPMTVRVFAARTPQGWTVMPGGYARIGRTGDAAALAMQQGGSVADVWIASDAPPESVSLTEPATGPFVRRMPGLLPSRAADNLFWLGRYVERAEGLIRLLRAYHMRLSGGGTATQPLLDYLKTYLGTYAEPDDPVPEALLDLLGAARSCALRVRDRFSPDGWLALDELEEAAREMAGTRRAGDDAARAMGDLLRRLAGFSGLVNENMFRFTGWRFLTIGRSLERAHAGAELLRVFADDDAPSGAFDVAVEVADSVMTHRRRYSVETNRATVIDLLALDDKNPRAVVYQVALMRGEVAELPAATVAGRMSELSSALLRLHTELQVVAPEDLDSGTLAGIRDEIAALSDRLSAQYLA